MPGSATPTLAERILGLEAARLRAIFRGFYLGLIWILLAAQAGYTLQPRRLVLWAGDVPQGTPDSPLMSAIPAGLLVLGVLLIWPLCRRGRKTWTGGLVVLAAGIGAMFGYDLEGSSGAVMGALCGLAVQWLAARIVWWISERMPENFLRYILGALVFTVLGWLVFLPLLWLGGTFVLGGSPGVGSLIARRGMGGLTILFTLPVWPVLAWNPRGWRRWARRAIYGFGAVLAIAWLLDRRLIDSRRMNVADEDIGLAFYMVVFWAILAWHNTRAAIRKPRNAPPPPEKDTDD